ncbi:MAG: hypothetical protein M3342_06215 [Bacteroidota bacterium]|nr:hypothetical protein [Flavisolibacter sp.]MDQ3843595.1 hypothetical protein [Bacteroidota bacterium]
MNKILLLLLITLATVSCAKEEVTCKNGFIHWEGDPAADGLGWVFREDNTGWPVPYKLKNLPADFQTDNLPVNVCLYKTDETFHCLCAAPLNVYKVTRIRRR